MVREYNLTNNIEWIETLFDDDRRLQDDNINKELNVKPELSFNL